MIDEWRDRHQRLFSGRPLLALPFQHLEWRVIGVPFGLGMSRTERQALTRAVSILKDQTLCICGARDEFGSAQPMVVTSLEDFNPTHAFEGTVLGHIDSAIYSESERWAMTCSPEGFSLVAGTDDALDVIVAELGGESALQSRLEALILEGEYGEPAAAREALSRYLPREV